MADPNVCKLSICKEIWNGEIKTVNERINGIQILQGSLAKELERRMYEANNMKAAFGKELDTVEKKVDRLEARYGFGITVVVIGFTIFQIALQIVFRIWK